MKKLQLRQLFEAESATYTYLLFDSQKKEAVIIDPVLETFERDASLIKELGLKLRYVLETHVHADHITSSYKLKEKFGAQIGVGKSAEIECVDVQIDDGQEFNFGDFQIKAIATPGHTNTCTSFVCEDMVFTGDALLIRGCGRTDFQEGSSKKLFDSIREKLFSLADGTTVYPGHDYKGFTSSTIAEEKQFNSRLALEKSEQEFVEIMDNLNLDHPKKIEQAVPANLKCGRV